MGIIRHIEGNPLTLAVPLTKITRRLTGGVETVEEEDFLPEEGSVRCVFSTRVGSQSVPVSMEGNVLLADCGGLPEGTWSIEMTCRDLSGKDRRYYRRDVLRVVNATADAGLPGDVEFDAAQETLEGSVFFYARGEDADIEGCNDAIRRAGEAVERVNSALAGLPFKIRVLTQ